MQVFLTGATGFIGRSLTRGLLARGWRVTALVRRPDSPPARTLAALGVRCVPGDVTDRASLRAGMAGADLLIHNAGHNEYGVTDAGRRRMRAVNIEGTDNVLGVAGELGVRRAVHVSSTQAYGDSGPQPADETFTRRAATRTWYERTKTDAHALARRYQAAGLPLAIVCPTGVVGPNDPSPLGGYMRLYVNRLMPPFAWGPATVISVVDVEDVAEGIALAGERGRPGETYFLTGEALTLREHLDYWARTPGGFRVRYWLPPRLAALVCWPLEGLQHRAGLLASVSRETVALVTLNMNYSNAKARRELGWSCRSAWETWSRALAGERALRARRPRRDLVSMLRVVESYGWADETTDAHR